MSASRYRVTAPTKVFGVEPGETFTREIPEVQEARLIASGAIERVRSYRKPAPITEPAPQAETEAESLTEGEDNG